MELSEDQQGNFAEKIKKGSGETDLAKARQQLLEVFLRNHWNGELPFLDYEKAFAKYHGSYEALVGGNPEKALNTIAGAPGRMIDNKKISTDDLWDLLRT